MGTGRAFDLLRKSTVAHPCAFHHMVLRRSAACRFEVVPMQLSNPPRSRPAAGTSLATAPAARRLPVGAEVQPDGVHFRVWAPSRQKIEVIVESFPGVEPGAAFALQAEAGGYHAGLVPGLAAGARYRYRLDGGDVFPDPASRFQPEGPHGPSEVVDPSAYAWDDAAWKGLTLPGQVLYELHLGTFTREGTWEAAAEQLPALVDLGITCIEVMPVAEFAGLFGWGYDGVALYAPYHVYGTPDDARRFVDRAHALGLGVIMDVVYNHLGPDGAYHRSYAEHYYHPERPKGEWGDSLNFDGAESGPVREFFKHNAGYWIDEFHLDGLRLDATQAILDDSPEHFLAEMSRHTRAIAEAAGRSIILIAEDESQQTSRVDPVDAGGQGLDAVWNDDFHHAALVALTGRSEAYYSDYAGSPQELVSAIKWGFLYQGQLYPWQKKRRGQPAWDLKGREFVTFLENHDQVANSATGGRLCELAAPARLRAMTAAWLLAPGTPMFFQGQEFGSCRPFLFFADHHDELSPLVEKGRREFLQQFPSAAEPAVSERLSAPHDEETFRRCVLDRQAAAGGNAEAWLALHRDLLRLRREDPVFGRQESSCLHGVVLGPEAFAIRYVCDTSPETRLLIVNLGRDIHPLHRSDPIFAPPSGHAWQVAWHSEHPDYGGRGMPPYENENPWRLPGQAALVLVPARLEA
jgi:maltooligosyltrehalose trehalohydrolase